MNFESFLQRWISEESISTEDVLSSCLPLLREVMETHRAGKAAPLEGLQALKVEGNRIWFEESQRMPLRNRTSDLSRIERRGQVSVEVLGESRRTTDAEEGVSKLVRLEIGDREHPVTRPVYLPGYVSWEHAVEHHDPLTDIFSLGMILASLACQLNLNEPDDLEKFVEHRRNLFALNRQLHPVLAQAILRMTELDRHQRTQDLPALVQSLENYRDQSVSFEIDLARLAQSQPSAGQSRQHVILSKLRERLFDISRRNNLLHFRPTMQSVNLTQASVPLMLDIRNVRNDQILVWNERLRKQLADGDSISLNKHLNFSEALYLPSLLERIMADARRDLNEFGFVQLRLVLCFLSWANLKERPVEQYVSPLVLLPVKLSKKKGIRDTYFLESLAAEAEVNPVLRHQFRQLYNIELPETVDLAATKLESLYELLAAQIQASEPAVTLDKIDRPRIDLIHEKAKRRLDHYRRSARVSGRGVRHFGDLDYSYDPANYHPLGIKLFSAKVRAPANHLRDILEEQPRPRNYMLPAQEPHSSDPLETTANGAGKKLRAGEAKEADAIEAEKSFFHLRSAAEENPYLWSFDLCNLTLANFRYRRMSLARDYESLLQRDIANRSFDAAFSLAPRPAGRELPDAPPLRDRFDVVPCDPTQATAVAEARRGESYIIQGPPGTGKSQTITNLIADYAAQGKRVLFVCEKRAAIDVVYSRLRQCGLGPLCCLIHDSQTDKKEFVLDLKQTYEAFLEERATANVPPAEARERIVQGLQQHLAPLEQFESLMEMPLAETNLSTRQFLDRCIKLIDHRLELRPEEMERLPRYEEWWPHADRLAALPALTREIEPSGILARHPLRRIAPKLVASERPIEQVSTGMERALPLVAQVAQTFKSCGIPDEGWRTIDRARLLLDYMRLAEPLAGSQNLLLVDSASARTKQFLEAMKLVDEAWNHLTDIRQATTHWNKKLPPADLQAALEQANQWRGKWWACFSLGWWRLRRVLHECYDFSSHKVRPSWVQILEPLAREYWAQEQVEQVERRARKDFGIECELESFRRSIAALQDALPQLPEWLRKIHAALAKSDKAAAFVARTLPAREPLERLGELLPEVMTDWEELSLDQLRAELDSIRADARKIPQALQVLGELKSLPPTVGAALRRMPHSLEQIEATVAHRSWNDLLLRERVLRQFDGRARQRYVAGIESGYDDWLNANAAEICERVRAQFLEHVRVASLPAPQLSAEQKEFRRRFNRGRRTLEHEFGKSMRYKAIRELVDGDSGVVVRDLKPVWLMSPLSVSDTAPLVPDFVDVVIFDEASQILLEDSIPSLFRGRQIIVVGDEMQLPPTAFFAAKQSEEDEELVFEEAGEQINYDLDSDSLLNHAAKNLPSTMLGWHYRSRSESLISFSNWAFYDGRLLTVPDHQLPMGSDAASNNEASAKIAAGSNATPAAQPASLPTPSSSALLMPEEAAGFHSAPPPSPPADVDLLLKQPISFHLLKHAIYDKRRNRAEAEYIAKLVSGLLKQRLQLTVGVIAFSEAQQDEIMLALNRLAQDDEEFRALYEEELQREDDGQFVGLLVKNLENIQGDERDVIILSVCYGPGPTGRMLMNFGPINKSGGEKRLNVAFTRAKQYMAIVSSIQHTAITNEYNDGANCLKNYLHYAESHSRGDAESARRTLTRAARWRDSAASSASNATADAVSLQLAETLRSHGYLIDQNVGQSHFRVDLAIRRAGDNNYRLGILIDTVAHYEQAEALEREMMRPRLLRNFGWRIVKILAKDWYEDNLGQLNALLKMLK